MAQLIPLNLSQRFSQMIGRKVTFTPATAVLGSKIKQVYGIYSAMPLETAIVVQADLRLLGSFAGCLVGLPDALVSEHLKVTPIEELLRDAIYEVLNIASSVISTQGRVVFTKMVTDPIYIEGAAAKVIKKPDHRSYFNVLVEGYQAGRFSVLAPFSAGRIVTF